MDIDSRSIAARGALARERIESGRAVAGPPAPRTLTAPDEEVIERLCGRAGVDRETFRARVLVDRWPADEPLPEWIGRFETVLGWIETPQAAAPTATDWVERPFAGVLGRIVAGARRRLPTGGPAVDALSEHLCSRLADLAAKALHADYLAFVAATAGTDTPEEVVSRTSTTYREQYCEAFCEERAATVFERYPVLARQVTLVVDAWTTFTRELCGRLEATDTTRETTPTENGSVIPSAAVSGVGVLGDTHDHGRAVCRVDLETGRSVVYKPRPIGCETALYEFQRSLATLDGHPSVPTPATTDCGTHGWVERVTHATLETGAAVSEFYTVAGALTFHLYLLAAVDAHHDNVVATEHGPVLVDAETLFHLPTADPESHRPDRAAAVDQYHRSVLCSQLLPVPVDRGGTERAGFAATVGETGTERVTWHHPTTDAISAVYEPDSFAPEHNLPLVDGQFSLLRGSLDAFVNGFRRAYDAVRRNRETVRERLQTLFGGVRTRRLLLDTYRYTAALGTLSNPEYLRDGFRFGCKARSALGAVTADRPSAVVDNEVRALLRRDVPSFVLDSTDTRVRPAADDTSVAETATPGLEHALDRLDALSRADCRRQTALLRATITGTAHATPDPHGSQYD